MGVCTDVRFGRGLKIPACLMAIDPDAVTAGHLCQMYKQTHQTARALVMCA
jgi:hypothetical protein